MSASAALEISTRHGWLVGFGNMVAKEYASWWRTRRAVVHLLLWLFVINAFILLIGLDEGPAGGRNSPLELLEELIEIFIRVGGLFATIGIVVATQSTVVSERQLGTAEWVLSKPVSRPAFLLSKFVVNGASFIWLAVAVPATVFYLQTLLHAYVQPALLPFLAGMLLHIQHLLFYLAFTLMLGTFFHGRGSVSGIAIGFLFGGLILPSFFPWMTGWLPWALPSLAAMAAQQQPLPAGSVIAIIISLLWTLLCILVALWRFEREEF